MKKIIVNEKYDNKKILRILTGLFPEANINVFRKALRNKDIRIDGRRISEDIPVRKGSEISIYLPDLAFEAQNSINSANSVETTEIQLSNSSEKKYYNIIFSDENIVIVNKKPGIAVHSGEGIQGPALIDMVRHEIGDFAINLCHRIDMNTGGLIILARNQKIVAEVTKALREGLIVKRYRCLVKGFPKIGQPVLCADRARMFEIRAYLERKQNSGTVYIHDTERPGDLEIITRYRILNHYEGVGPDSESVSEIEAELVSGRTHQIRAHFAHIGHPLLGDGKYGRNSYNKHFKNYGVSLNHQQLWATTLKFGDFSSKSPLSYLSGRVFKSSAEFTIKFD